MCQGRPLNCIPLTCNDCRSTNQTQEPDIAVEVEAIERKKPIKSANVVIPHTILNVFLQNPPLSITNTMWKKTYRLKPLLKLMVKVRGWSSCLAPFRGDVQKTGWKGDMNSHTLYKRIVKIWATKNTPLSRWVQKFVIRVQMSFFGGTLFHHPNLEG